MRWQFPIIRYFYTPLIFYLIGFTFLTYPAMLQFHTHLFAALVGDGLQNYWNLWWVNKAVTQLHQSPWYTTYLHYPYGVTLIGHTLNPFNGFLGIILLGFLSLERTYNLIVIFSFITGGVTMFYLSFYLTKSYVGSLVAGYIFTFSNFHFAQLEGHLQLVSLEWVPLFILFWYIFLQKPTTIKAFLAAFALFLVILCDYYYFFYCVLIGFLMVFWLFIKKPTINLFKKENLIPSVLFIFFVVLSSGILVANLFFSNIRDPFMLAHPASNYSSDLLTPFIPGPHSRFAELTESYWTLLPSGGVEIDGYLGWAVIIMIIYIFLKRKWIHFSEINFFYLMIFLFFVFSLGPILHIWGHKIDFPFMPYRLLEKFLPLIDISGMPIRMIVIVNLYAALLFAIGINHIFKEKGRIRLFGILLLALLIFEYLPNHILLARLNTNRYLKILKNLPDSGGVLEIGSDLTYDNNSLNLYYQTIHEKPIGLGYISRIPESVSKKDNELIRLIQEKDWKKIYYAYNMRYVIFLDKRVDCPIKILIPIGHKIKLSDPEQCLN